MFGIDDAIAAGLKILDKFVPDPELKAKAETELRTALLDADKGQMAVNAAEATHRSIFVAGWRPSIGWACSFAFVFHFIAMPVVEYICAWQGVAVQVINFDMNNLMTIMMGMLGIAGMRTYEKIKGVSK